MIDVVESSIAELRSALETGTATAVELVRAYLMRIEAYDRPATPTALNALVVGNPDALEEAAASDLRRSRGEMLGPLDGIPYTAKDSYLVKGLTAASGSPAFANLMASATRSRSSDSAPAVRSASGRPTCRPWRTAACSAGSTAVPRARTTLTT